MDLLIGDGGEFPSFREVHSYQTVGVLFESSLPGRVGVHEVEIGSRVPGNALMTGELFPIVRGESVILLGLRPEQVENGPFDAIGTLVVQSCNQNQP